MHEKFDSVGLWLAVAGILEGMAAVTATLLSPEYRFWALVPALLGAVALFWSLSLFLAHRMASAAADRPPGTTQALAVSGSRLDSEVLDAERERRYRDNRGLFLIHTWRPSQVEGQKVDIEVRLTQHGPGPLSQGTIKSVMYTFGRKFEEHTRTVTNAANGFAVNDSIYSPLLVLAQVSFTDGSALLLLERYINFEEWAAVSDPEIARAVAWDEEHYSLVVSAMHTGSPTLQHLKDVPSPYIDFVFEIVNGSLLEVRIGREIEGQMVCSGIDLQRTPAIRFANEWATSGMKHGWGTNLTLRQWLTPEEVAWIREKRNSADRAHPWFSFINVDLAIHAGEKRRRLDLNRGQSVYLTQG